MARKRASYYLVSLVTIPVLWAAVAFSVNEALAPSPPGDGAEAVECGRDLADQPEDGVSHTESARVVLVSDEEWRSVLSGPHPAEARRVLLDAAGLFRGMSIHLLPVRIVDWASPSDAVTVRDVWEAARDTVPLGDADIVVVLSAQERTNAQDGYATVGGRYAVAAHHPEHPERDALVLAHEISHLFGANHGCDVPEREGLMASNGFDHDLICPCTRRVLEMNANRFHGISP